MGLGIPGFGALARPMACCKAAGGFDDVRVRLRVRRFFIEATRIHGLESLAFHPFARVAGLGPA